MDIKYCVDVNELGGDGYAPIHKAIFRNDFDMLAEVLSHPECDVNLRNLIGESPLMMCLVLRRSSVFMAQLLRRGCDLNFRDVTNSYSFPVQESFLKTAIKIPFTASEIDGFWLHTKENNALSYAVAHNDLETVCVLLYYGANITVFNNCRMTPLMLAFCQGANDIAQLLMGFSNDYSHRDSSGNTALRHACLSVNPLAFDLIKAGVDVNLRFGRMDSLFVLSLKYPNSGLFKLMWSKVDFGKILHIEPLLLVKYVNQAKFKESELLEVLVLMLRSPVGFELLDRAVKREFFIDLLHCFVRLGVSSGTRMAAIHLCLSMGPKVDTFDIHVALKYYGFGPEAEAFIYNIDCAYSVFHDSYVLNRFLGFNCNKYSSIAFQTKEGTVNWLSYHTPSSDVKDKLKIMIGPNNLKCLQAVAEMSNVPLLMELCRDAVCHNIRQNADIKKPYHFYDIIKGLDVSAYIKDLLTFKVPIASMRDNAMRIVSML